MESKLPEKVIVKLDLYSLAELILFAVGIWLLLKIYPLVLGLYIAFILAAILKPFLDFALKFTNHKVNKRLVSFFIYVVLVSIVVIVFSKLISIFVGQFVALLEMLSYPSSIQKLIFELKHSKLLAWLTPYLDSETVAKLLRDLLLRTISVNNTIRGAQNLLAAIPGVIYILLASWYFLTDRDTLLAYALMPVKDKKLRKQISSLVETIEVKLGRWAAAQLALMLIIGVLSFIALKILGVNYALSLAIIAGFLELIPNLGPLISLIPAVLVALMANGLITAILVVLAYLIIQQLENMFIVPHIMGGVVGLHPLIVLIAITLGQAIAGVSGALLAIPSLFILKIIAESDFFAKTSSHSGA